MLRLAQRPCATCQSRIIGDHLHEPPLIVVIDSQPERHKRRTLGQVRADELRARTAANRPAPTTSDATDRFTAETRTKINRIHAEQQRRRDLAPGHTHRERALRRADTLAPSENYASPDQTNPSVATGSDVEF